MVTNATPHWLTNTHIYIVTLSMYVSCLVLIEASLWQQSRSFVQTGEFEGSRTSGSGDDSHQQRSPGTVDHSCTQQPGWEKACEVLQGRIWEQSNDVLKWPSPLLRPVYTCDFRCDFWCDFAYKTRLTLPCTNVYFAKHLVDWRESHEISFEDTLLSNFS